MRGFNQTITVWNRWPNPSTRSDEWYRHSIPNCSWESQIITTATSGGAIASNVYNVLVAENEKYMPYKDWSQLSTDQKLLYFTFNKKDLVALGDNEVEITNQKPYTVADVKTMFDPDSFYIQIISDQTEQYKRGRHYKLVGA